MRRRPTTRSPGHNGALGGFRLVDAPGHLLRRCQQRAVEIFMEELRPLRLTPRQFAVLIAVGQRPGLTQTELVADTGIDRSTIGDMLDRLVRRGLLRRERSGRDQRANRLRILPAGLRALAAALPHVRRAQQRILAPVPASQRTAIITVLRQMAGVPAATGGSA